MSRAERKARGASAVGEGDLTESRRHRKSHGDGAQVRRPS